jgi:diacylglycerol kinase (ATP)
MQAASRNIAIVCNPLAGNGKAVQLAARILAELRSRNISNQVFDDNWPLAFDEFTDVFIVGGDGTLNYFINHYPDITIPLAIFNGGTGNDLHWLLYGETGLAEQLELVLSAAAKPVDAGKCNDRYFINGVGIGFDGAVAKSLTGKKKKAGKTSFMIAILKRIFFYRSRTYTISSEQINQTSASLLLGVANGRRAGGGFHIAPEASATDGLLDVICVGAISPLKRLRYLPVIEKGKHLNLSFIQYYKTKKIRIASTREMDAHLDGEYYCGKAMQIEILPGRFLFRF